MNGLATQKDGGNREQQKAEKQRREMEPRVKLQ